MEACNYRAQHISEIIESSRKVILLLLFFVAPVWVPSCKWHIEKVLHFWRILMRKILFGGKSIFIALWLMTVIVQQMCSRLFCCSCIAAEWQCATFGAIIIIYTGKFRCNLFNFIKNVQKWATNAPWRHSENLPAIKLLDAKNGNGRGKTYAQSK